MPVSHATVRRLRRGWLLAIALGTTLLAIALIVHALSPGHLPMTPTSQLVAILALLLLPAGTIGAWAWDRSVRLRFVRIRPDDQRPDNEPLDPRRAREHPAGRTRPHTAPSEEPRRAPESESLTP